MSDVIGILIFAAIVVGIIWLGTGLDRVVEALRASGKETAEAKK